MRDRGEEGEAPPEGRLIGPFLSPSGAMSVIPHPLDSGPPQPEPEERWTLGPRPRQTGDEAEPPVEVERVHGGGVRFAGDDPDAPGAADE